MKSTVFLFVVFMALQLAANVLFKFGAMASGRYIPCFIAGNVFGMSSIWFMMKLYERMNVNIAMAIGGGATFLLVQIAMAFLFNSRLSALQWAGIAAVSFGVAVTALAAPPVNG